MSKAFASEADAVLIDLEDAVATSAKQLARDNVCRLLETSGAETSLPWVRINAGDVGRADLVALGIHSAHIAGLVLAKCDTVAWLDEVAAAVDDTVCLSPLIESAAAVRRIDALCAHPRVQQCHLGEIDLVADLGGRSAGAAVLVAHARFELVYASAASGILPPIGGVHPDIRDLDGLAETSGFLAELGFNGRPALHPAQIAVINAAFTPTADEVEAATRVVGRYDAATSAGIGAVADDDGSMLDEAVVRSARRVLARGARSVSRRQES